MTNPTIPSSGALGRARPDLILYWLLVCAALVVAMVVVGGITRLTESGLSITQWNPVSGAIPPLNHADWLREFALYQQTTEFQTVNRSMDLAAFKAIFFWEFFHRLLARAIGVVFGLPLLLFAWRRMIPAGFGRRLLLILALGGMQGVVGWWMVVSGLVGRTDVSHFRLATHLGLALVILAAIVWTARDMALLRRGLAVRPRLRLAPALVLIVLAIQIIWGAFTAGLNAGFAFDTWPLMGGEIFPAATPIAHGIWDAAVNNPVVVQFLHRWWAWAAATGLCWLAYRVRRHAPVAARVLAALVATQIMLGIATLLTGVEITVAVAHQGCAALLVALGTWCAHAYGASMQRLQ
ncbi:MAG: COX15/CtaA family protein [Sphingomonadaceae bacterium]|nr:COX15/CtaA family protein [Sphingomonadaceae bacterium]